MRFCSAPVVREAVCGGLIQVHHRTPRSDHSMNIEALSAGALEPSSTPQGGHTPLPVKPGARMLGISALKLPHFRYNGNGASSRFASRWPSLAQEHKPMIMQLSAPEATTRKT